MQFLFPINERKQLSVPVPAQDQAYFMHSLPADLVQGAGGDLLVQHTGNELFDIQLQVLHCRQPHAIRPYMEKTKIVLFYMLEGNFGVRLQDGRPIPVKEGYYCWFVFPGSSRTAAGMTSPVAPLWLDPGRYVTFHIELRPAFYKALTREAMLPGAIDAPGDGSGRMQDWRKAIITPAIRSVIDAIRQCRETGPAKNLYIDIRVKTLFLEYLRDRHLPQKRLSSSIQLMEAIALYIQMHLDEAIPIQTLARQFYLSLSTLNRHFLKYYGLPVHRYILQQRMEWARELLKRDVPVGDVADQTGYKNISAFTRAFIQFFGYPPSRHGRR